MRFTTGPCNGIPVTCNLKLPRCYTKTAIMAEQLILGMWPTISHLLSPKQHSMIRVVHIPHIGTKKKPLTKAGSPNILVHVVATYDAFQAVLGFLCHNVLRCLLDVHTHVDAYNRMVRGYTNLIIKRIFFFCDHFFPRQ